MSKCIHTTSAPTRRQIQACAPFGLVLKQESNAVLPGPQSAARHLRNTLHPGQVALVTGPSGSGKSTSLRLLAEDLRRADQRVLLHETEAACEGLLIDLFGSDMDPGETMTRLAAFGLAEPALMARTIDELSEGQRHRACLARSFFVAEKTRTKWIIIDEFASVLDRITARALAATVARVTRNSPVRLVCATAHDDLGSDFGEHISIRFDSREQWNGQYANPGKSLARSIGIEPGTHADMQALLPFHYIAGPPATRVGFLRAFDPIHDTLAGVLVVSMPTLNGAWRNQAWPGRYTGPDRKASARRINAELRCISRVIIDPRYRGLGLACRLVRVYLDNPLSQATEAIAAMGSVCPFFERAGMTSYTVPCHPADARLADALHAVGFEPWMLADPSHFDTILAHALIRRELSTWQRVRRIKSLARPDLIRLAGARLCIEPRAYASVSPHRSVSCMAPQTGGKTCEQINDQ